MGLLAGPEGAVRMTFSRKLARACCLVAMVTGSRPGTGASNLGGGPLPRLISVVTGQRHQVGPRGGVKRKGGGSPRAALRRP